MENIKVSVIIPSLDGYRDGKVPQLLKMLKKQRFKEMEVILIKGISPQGKAINIGAEKAKGEILVIMDDDSLPADEFVIERLISPFEKDPKIGMTGASIRPSPDSSLLQKLISREFPRFSMPVVSKIVESDFPCHGCCAIPKRIFFEIGKEDEELKRGLDPDLRERIRKKGYKIVLAPECVVYHPPPESLSKFLRMMYRNGVGSGFAQKVKKERVFITEERLKSTSKLYKPFALRVMKYPFNIIFHLSKLRIFRVIGCFVYGIGVLRGLLMNEDKT
ncbi:MAG: hypothetical protein DRP67_05565 [Candidatus Omnitrophota bacterium]|nr:MAG: hypothetical protein DRP67_05565 [Candidatus Omnitrophota bacterium]